MKAARSNEAAIREDTKYGRDGDETPSGAVSSGARRRGVGLSLSKSAVCSSNTAITSSEDQQRDSNDYGYTSIRLK